MRKIKVAILGANGYTGMQLISLLINHSYVEINCITSRKYVGKKLSSLSSRFNSSDLVFEELDIENISQNCDLVFLALPHGVSQEYVPELMNKQCKIIDLSADFRLLSPNLYKKFYEIDHQVPELLEKFTYGLVEHYGKEIKKSSYIASPGCYPTSILLPLLPLVQDELIDFKGIVINSVSGISGAGKALKENLLYVERNESVVGYNSIKHRHLAEIEQELFQCQQGKFFVDFIPHLVPMSRGMHTTISIKLKNGIDSKELIEALNKKYKTSPFVHIFDNYVDTKDVIHTNCCHIYPLYNPRSKRFVIHSVIDNLVKGAGGQAIQAMNIMYNLDEKIGLSHA